MSIQEESPHAIETLSPYGYRIAGMPPNGYVPLTATEPGSVAASSQEGDVDPAAYDGSGQPVGPDLWRRVQEAAQTPEGAEMLRRLLRLDERAPRTLVYEGVVGCESDGSGNLFGILFDVPNGARAYLTRCLLEVGGQAPNSAVVASTWAGVFETGGGTTQPTGLTTAAYQPGQLRDFAPKNSSSGLFFPVDLVNCNKDNAWGFRAGSRAVVVVAGAAGIAAKQCTVAYKFLVEFDQTATAT